MLFKDQAHQAFYEQAITADNVDKDPKRQSFFYVLGLDRTVREHIGDLYDFNHHLPRAGGLNKTWQTSGSLQTCRLALNLYNCFAGNDSRDALIYTPYYLFNSNLAPYYLEAVKLRFPATAGRENKKEESQ